MSVSTQHKSSLTKIAKLLIAVLILFLGYRIVSVELLLKKYEKAFLQVKHPEQTTRLDSFGLEVNDYPATYVDDSIQFQSAFLVGEIRSYDGNWEALKTFYSDQALETSKADRLPVWPVPIQIERGDQGSRLDFPHELSFDPFQAQILQALQDHYSSGRSMQRLGRAEGNIYFVYMFAEP
jgi:hypothetical protein